MKRVLFLMLFLLVLGAVNMSAQVRIGGDGEPHTAAVLDLNTDDTDAGNKGALALPRVSLATDKDQLNGATPLTGMLVYNTNTTMGKGVYFWDGSNWVIISGDGIVGNEVTNATAGGGLVRSGSGTVGDPYTLGIANNGITTGMIAAGSVSMDKTTLTVNRVSLSGKLGLTANASLNIAMPTGCVEGKTWVSYYINNHGCVQLRAGIASVIRFIASTSSANDYIDFYCIN